MSVKRKSRILASCFLAKSSTVLASAIVFLLGDRLLKRTPAEFPQAGRLLQSGRVVRTDESTASHTCWQFDCSYSRDKAEFILKLSASSQGSRCRGGSCG